MGRIGRRIELTDEQRTELKRFVSSGEHPSRIVRRAHIILSLDAQDGKSPPTQGEVASRLGVSRETVANVKADFIEGGLDRLLARRRRKAPPVPAKADGEYEAHLIALSRMEPPPGYSRWTTRLLADKSVELEYIDSISYSTVSRILKKTSSSST